MPTLMAGSSKEASAVLKRHRTYLSGPSAAEALWRKLTTEQKRKVGGSLSAALTRHGHPTHIWMHLHPNLSQKRAVVELAVKIFSYPTDEAEWLLREFDELPMDEEAAQAEAISRGDLVLIRRNRTVYWNSGNLNVEWGMGDESWNTLLIMCESALRNEDIDRFSFPGEAHEDVVAKKKSRLKRVDRNLAELVGYLQRVRPRTQRFTFPANRIHIFDD